jgi:hypothetical protein
MRILGLDIGSTSIKAVEVDTAFGRFEIHEYHEVPIAPGGASSIEAAGTLIRSLPRSPDRVIVPLRSNRVTLRNLRLPTRDKNARPSKVTSGSRSPPESIRMRSPPRLHPIAPS